LREKLKTFSQKPSAGINVGAFSLPYGRHDSSQQARQNGAHFSP